MAVLDATLHSLLSGESFVIDLFVIPAKAGIQLFVFYLNITGADEGFCELESHNIAMSEPNRLDASPR